ncbi:MAG: hypothetical protein ABI210_07910 [Abditibacteriaceae bacterium]
MKLKRTSIAGVAVIIGAGILAGPRVVAWAQTLAGSMAAGAAGATLGAAGGAGLLTPSQYAKKATDAAKKTNSLDRKRKNTGGPNMPNVSMKAQQPQESGVQPLRWGYQNGKQMLHQLTNSAHQNYSSGSVRKSRHHRNVLSKYIKPSRGWLAYYLPQDRYKMNKKVWQFTTTPNDKFYYQPWVLATKRRPPGEVIGFHTWQDAVIAGYRPDPVSLPEPGRQLATLASYSQGDMMQKFIEFTYNGQINPIVFDADYKYVIRVAHAVKSSHSWSYLLEPTVDQAIGATLGLNDPPNSIGSSSPTQPKDQAGAPGAPGKTTPPGEENTDPRMANYNKLQNNAADLSKKPGA